MQLLHDLIFDYTLRNVALGAAIIGIVNGALGSFAVLRKQSLLGDTISHAALPGIALAFLVTGSKSPLTLMVGAGLAGWLGTYFVLSIINRTKVKEDSALGIILSVFFGIGILLIKKIERMSTGNKSGLDKFLFGQAASLMTRDVVIMAILGGIVILFLILFWKEFAIMTFNPEFGEAQGFSKRLLDTLLVSLIVVSIVIGLQTVGVVLMSAAIVIPATAARQWSNRLVGMVCLSACFGATAGVGGALVSNSAKIPPGPAIVLCFAAIIAFSLLAAPGRGMVWELLRRRRNKKRFHLDGILLDLYMLTAQHDDFSHKHSIKTLETMCANKQGVKSGLEFLAEKGYAKDVGDGFWSLTEDGLAQAKIIEDHQQEEPS